MSFSVDFATYKGLGREPSTVPSSWVELLLASEHATFVLYSPSLMAIKTSILILYLRISKNTRLFLKTASYVTLAIVNIAGIVTTLLTVFRCRPVRSAYTPGVAGSQCISIQTIYLASAPVNVAANPSHPRLAHPGA